MIGAGRAGLLLGRPLYAEGGACSPRTGWSIVNPFHRLLKPSAGLPSAHQAAPHTRNHSAQLRAFFGGQHRADRIIHLVGDG